MAKRQIRLKESDLNRIVSESINKVLNESFGPNNTGIELPKKGWNMMKTYNLNIEHNGELVYAIENHQPGKVYLLGNGHAGFTLIGYFDELEPQQQEVIRQELLKRMQAAREPEI